MAFIPYQLINNAHFPTELLEDRFFVVGNDVNSTGSLVIPTDSSRHIPASIAGTFSRPWSGGAQGHK